MTQELTADQLVAVANYAALCGRNWKSKLNHDWLNGNCAGPLQQVRNQFGPTWLKNFNLNAELRSWRAVSDVQITAG